MISCAVCARKEEDVVAQFGGDAIGIQWFTEEEVKALQLAFDHKEIIEDAMAKYYKIK